MTHSYVWHDSFLHLTRLIVTSDMTHWYEWHDSFKWVTWLILTCGMTQSYVWHNSCLCVTWLFIMCGMIHPCVWHDSSLCVTWLILTCDMTESYMWQEHRYAWHDSFLRVMLLIFICDMTHSNVWHDSFFLLCDMNFPTCNAQRGGDIKHAHQNTHNTHTHIHTHNPHTHVWVDTEVCDMSHLCMSHVTQMNEPCPTNTQHVSHIRKIMSRWDRPSPGGMLVLLQHCNTLQKTPCITLHTLQNHTIYCNLDAGLACPKYTPQQWHTHTATRCNTLLHIATHCYTL